MSLIHTASSEAPAGDWAEAAEAHVLQVAVGLAPQLGWSETLVVAAAGRAGLSRADAALLMPGGPRDLAALLSRSHDRAALASLSATDPMSLKIRERIRRAVLARVEAAAQEAEAVRRCVAFLALPTNAALGLSLLWESADALWRWAGDTATDENHYSKRAILSGVLAEAVAARLNQGQAAAEARLDQRIGQVMSFEKWKAGLPRPSDTLVRLAGALGRMRYGRPTGAEQITSSPADPSAG